MASLAQQQDVYAQVLVSTALFLSILPANCTTEALWIALQQLGYTPYHGNELFTNAKHRHNKCWQEGLTTRYNTGKSYGLVEFDKLLGNYDVRLGRF